MSNYIVTSLWIYPVKSLGGIRVPSAKVMMKGLQYDRRWMLIDSTDTFMTQREFPRMALFKMTKEDDKIIVNYEGNEIDITANTSGPKINATVWNDRVDVYEVSEEHSKWFSRNLGVSCRLVHLPEDSHRPVEINGSFDEGSMSLADAYPLLIIGQSTLDDLNSRLIEAVPMNRFRPNIVFEGAAAYEEDSWKMLSVGVNRFSGVKQCARCPITTVNQDTAEKGKEPLATLAGYRKSGNKVLFGQNLVPLDYSMIAEGDEIISAG
ncbi:MAG: MOSC domain-containing protein [Chitinophagaceae bacterium]|nr:MOSC domain-containing protein [Chitinophagaceae bacterium]